jgi:hypothetical protein
MPDNVVKGLADKSGKSISSVENDWESSTKDYLAKNNKNKSDLTSKDWAIITIITKNKLGIKESKMESFVESTLSAKEFLEADANVQVSNPGILEVPSGKFVDSLGQEHFKGLIKKKGWNEISKALMNLVRFNKNDDKKLSSWADKMQADLSDWVDSEREKNSNFGK